MTHAVVLISAQREALGTLGGQLAEIDGVSEMTAFRTFSEHDLEAMFSIGG